MCSQDTDDDDRFVGEPAVTAGEGVCSGMAAGSGGAPLVCAPAPSADLRSAPLISAIIPTLNRPELLTEAISSVMAQSFARWEVVVVNDGGTTPTIPGDPRIRLVEHPSNLGPSSARNSGVRAAQGRYVTFLDDDDTLSTDRFERVLPLLELGDVAVCSKSYGVPASVDIQTFLCGSGLSAGQFVVERSLCPSFDPDMRHGEDFDWALRLMDSPWLVDDAVGYHVRHHDGPRMTDDSERMITYRVRLLSKHAQWFARHPDAKYYQWRFIAISALGRRDYELARIAFAKAALVRLWSKAAIGAVVASVPWLRDRARFRSPGQSQPS